MTPPPAAFRLVYRSFDRVTYDPVKSDDILARRGFDLPYLKRMFPGWVLERSETRHCHDVRYQAVGEMLGNVWFVDYTRFGTFCHLITGWEADARERRVWYDAIR